MTTAGTSAARSCVACYSYEEGKDSIATPCCSRFVCGPCAISNPRLTEICVLCQLPIQQFAEPPQYDPLPAYNEPQRTKSCGVKELGAQHYVRKDDTINSLSIAYHVDTNVIRRANHIFADHLLQARLFVIIPGATTSLSAAPGKDEERKVRLKRFMLATKCTDYDMAKSMFSFDCANSRSIYGRMRSHSH